MDAESLEYNLEVVEIIKINEDISLLILLCTIEDSYLPIVLRVSEEHIKRENDEFIFDDELLYVIEKEILNFQQKTSLSNKSIYNSNTLH